MMGFQRTFVITADDAFPSRQRLLIPYGVRYLEHNKCILNYRLSCARRVYENNFGIATAKWRIFKRPIDGIPECCIGITKAMLSLRNNLMFYKSSLPRDERRYYPPGYLDAEDKNANVPGA